MAFCAVKADLKIMIASVSNKNDAISAGLFRISFILATRPDTGLGCLESKSRVRKPAKRKENKMNVARAIVEKYNK
ncbi:hypothetical protein GCM10017044_12960 [Kordiimonas sediminis]|uniref:Uncharacterized protein n=1 Tax=Kordiimonas sediminis TaxID=1735581 RepID=A0A919AP98_9PROT|nr:hypothetical protein GCM10017044_12960 [Kordiimonas sediminis]